MARGVGYYGFPSEKQLVARAMRLAGASVPTAASVRRQFNKPIGDVEGFTRALVSLLGKQDVGSAYDDPLADMRAMTEAGAARLAALGPEYAGAGVAAGSAADTGTARMLAGKAGASAYAAKQPGIAASRGALAKTGLVNAREEALTQRREALRQSFMSAYEQVRNNALALASANADIHQNDRAYREQVRQFDADTARMYATADGGGGPPDVNEDFQQVRDKLFDMAENFRDGREVPNPKYNPANPASKEPETITKRKSYDQAFKAMRSYARPYLRQLGYSNSQITKIIRKALDAAGYNRPKKPPRNAGKPYDWQ